MALSPTSSRGGGGSTPTLAAVLVAGNTAGKSIVVDGDSSYYLQGVGTAAEDSGGAGSVSLGATSGNNGGNLSIAAGAALAPGATPGTTFINGGSGWGANGARLVLSPGGDVDPGLLGVRTNDDLGSSGKALVSNGANKTVWNTLGSIKLDTHAAPADGTLAAGDLRLWFDQTNGAAKLMVKAKQADGTVVTAAVALA